MRLQLNPVLGSTTDLIDLSNPPPRGNPCVFPPATEKTSIFAKLRMTAKATAKDNNDKQALYLQQKSKENGKLLHISKKALGIIQEILTVKQIVEFALAPFYLYNVIKTGFTFNKLSEDKKIEAGLNVTSEMKEIGESTGAFVGALGEVKAIPHAHTSWLGPFAIVLSVLSLAGIVTNIRTSMKMRRLLKEIQFAENAGKIDGKLTQASLRNVMDLIEQKTAQDTDFVDDFFNADSEKFADAMVVIEYETRTALQSGNEVECQSAQDKVEKTLHALKGRIKSEIKSRRVAVISSIITLVGTALLFSGPAAPLGWVMLITAAGIDFLKLGHHKYTEYKFVKSIDMKRTKWEWVTC